MKATERSKCVRTPMASNASCAQCPPCRAAVPMHSTCRFSDSQCAMPGVRGPRLARAFSLQCERGGTSRRHCFHVQMPFGGDTTDWA
jgi:hypothetical protein